LAENTAIYEETAPLSSGYTREKSMENVVDGVRKGWM